MVIGLVVAALLAQAGPAAPLPADLERIRKALAEDPSLAFVVSSPNREGPIFRVTVHATGPNTQPWDNWTNVPSYIRPWWRGYHHDYLEMVTPEEFRSGTLYPVGIPVGPLLELLGKHIAWPQGKTREEKAREEVRQALEQFFACRHDSRRPGC
jgi:hypothetical protein